jgi:hypothetical protein
MGSTQGQCNEEEDVLRRNDDAVANHMIDSDPDQMSSFAYSDDDSDPGCRGDDQFLSAPRILPTRCQWCTDQKQPTNQ